MTNKITVIVLVKNKASLINTIYDMLRGFSEIIFIDDKSSDDTFNICKSLKVSCYAHSLNNDFASARNYGLSKAKYDWVFFIDSDETIDKDNMNKIMNMDLSQYDGFYIKRQVIFLGHKMNYTEMGNDRVLRLGKKSCGEWKRTVHEYWDIKGKVGYFDGFVLHNTATNLREFISKLSYYSMLHYLQNIKDNKYPYFYKVCFYPFYKFIYNYIFKLGFLDGIHGFVVSVLMSLHSFLSWSDSMLSNQPINHKNNDI